ncbi:MAG: zinc-ribbon domain-containing protein [Clostridiales bacterium]|nr:zinc-ribbon domain-containing protein [Clostridiales bacterium]
MFCSNCGKEIHDEAIICPNCGVATGKKIPVEQYEEKKEGNGMAVAGFVCSFFVPILGWVFGGIGLARSRKRNGKGKGLSIAGIAIATVMFFVYAGMY